jgi:hypothetical protein
MKRKAEGGSPPPAKQPALSASGRPEPSQVVKRPAKVILPPNPSVCSYPLTLRP